MSKKCQEILSELNNRASKKSRISGKQLLLLIREFCFYVSIAPDKQWIAPIIQIAKGTTDSDADHKIFRTCLYLVVSSLMSDNWKNSEKERISFIGDAVALLKDEIKTASGSRASLSWRTFGSLEASTTVLDISKVTVVAETITKLSNSKGAQQHKFTESEIQVQSAKLSALRRLLTGKSDERTSAVFVRCIDSILIAAASNDISIARHATALLQIATSASDREDSDNDPGISVIAVKFLATFQSSRQALNFSDPLSACQALKSIAAVSVRREVSDSQVIDLNLNALKLIVHPSHKIFAEMVKSLLGGARAKRIISLMQSASDKEFKKTSILSKIAAEYRSRLKLVVAIDTKSTVSSALVLPVLLRAVIYVGRFSCDQSVRFSDIDVLDKLWRTLLDLHDSIFSASSSSVHLLLDSLKALVWVTQSRVDYDGLGDDEGHQWAALTDRILRAIPKLNLGGNPVLAISLIKCVMERANQPESACSVDGSYVSHHSRSCLKLLIDAGESLVHLYPSTRTVLQLEAIWTYVAMFTSPPTADAPHSNTPEGSVHSNSLTERRTDESGDLSILSLLPDLPTPTLLSPFLDLRAPAPSASLESTLTPERAVHTFFKKSLLNVLDANPSASAASEFYGSGIDNDWEREREKCSAADLLSQHALWHLAEHTMLLPSARQEVESLVHTLTQYVDLGSESMREIAADGLAKLAVRCNRLKTTCLSDSDATVKQGSNALLLLLSAPAALDCVCCDDAITAEWAASMQDFVTHEIALIAGTVMGLQFCRYDKRSSDESYSAFTQSAPKLNAGTLLVQWAFDQDGDGQGTHEEIHSLESPRAFTGDSRQAGESSCWRVRLHEREGAAGSVMSTLWPVLLALCAPFSNTGTVTPIIQSTVSTPSRQNRGLSTPESLSNEEQVRNRASSCLERPKDPVWVTTKRPPKATPLTIYERDPLSSASSPSTPTNTITSRDTLLNLGRNNLNSIFGFDEITTCTYTTAESLSPSLVPSAYQSDLPLSFLPIENLQVSNAVDLFGINDFTSASSCVYQQDAALSDSIDPSISPKKRPVSLPFEERSIPLPIFIPSLLDASPSLSRPVLIPQLLPMTPFESVSMAFPPPADKKLGHLQIVDCSSKAPMPASTKDSATPTTLPFTPTTLPFTPTTLPFAPTTQPFVPTAPASALTSSSFTPTLPTTPTSASVAQSFSPTISRKKTVSTVTVSAESADLDFLLHRDFASTKDPSSSQGVSKALPSSQSSKGAPRAMLKPPPLKGINAKKPGKSTSAESPDFLNSAVGVDLLTSSKESAQPQSDPFATSAAAAFAPSVTDPFAVPFTASTSTSTSAHVPFAPTVASNPYPYSHPAYLPDGNINQYYHPAPYPVQVPGQYPQPYQYAYHQGGGYPLGQPPFVPPPGAPYGVPQGMYWQPPGSGVPLGPDSNNGGPVVVVVNPFDQFIKKT